MRAYARKAYLVQLVMEIVPNKALSLSLSLAAGAYSEKVSYRMCSLTEKCVLLL